MPQKLISLVVPVFNEEEMVTLFLERAQAVCSQLEGYRFQYLFVDDGSTDNTLALLLDLQRTNPNIRIVELSRNFGKEAALSAGLDFSDGNAAIPIDVDLQDPPELIPQLIREWENGYEVVLACRSDRQSDDWRKRITAAIFYRLHNFIGKPTIPANCGDFRLLDRVVVEALRQLPENQRFMKGLFAWVGFRTTTVLYTREKRQAGSSKFNGWRLFDFAIQGITSFSTAPLRAALIVGVLTTFLALIYAAFIIFYVLFRGIDSPGYASIMTVVLFLGGLQLTGIGFLGEYLGRNYFESKRRPPYIVRKTHDTENE
ncbi:MAG: glycosyltransferase family 2 protein [Pseudohongiellaceae bacterium]